MGGTCRRQGEDEKYKILFRNLESEGYYGNLEEGNKIFRRILKT
jgi:hypothetical protein